jgi:hypothetical protein
VAQSRLVDVTYTFMDESGYASAIANDIVSAHVDHVDIAGSLSVSHLERVNP